MHTTHPIQLLLTNNSWWHFFLISLYQMIGNTNQNEGYREWRKNLIQCAQIMTNYKRLILFFSGFIFHLMENWIDDNFNGHSSVDYDCHQIINGILNFSLSNRTCANDIWLDTVIFLRFAQKCFQHEREWILLTFFFLLFLIVAVVNQQKLHHASIICAQQSEFSSSTILCTFQSIQRTSHLVTFPRKERERKKLPKHIIIIFMTMFGVFKNKSIVFIWVRCFIESIQMFTVARIQPLFLGYKHINVSNQFALTLTCELSMQIYIIGLFTLTVLTSKYMVICRIFV